ncbi:MAG: alpha/beta hydrolase [Lachnospiraceae bacterium]|nr:alpha/beta hydrolase [Lachnospiraceae bacterium]
MVKKIDEIPVNYIDEGEGEVVLILHGWGANITLYRGIIDTLKQGRRVMALDMPGFGKTPEPSEPWCVDDYVDFVLHFIDTFSLKKLSVVVHSFGGRVFFKMNARENLPFSIERAVLIDSAGILPKKSFKQKVSLRCYKIGRAFMSTKVMHFLYPDAVDNMRRRRGSSDYNSATPLMRATLVKVVNEDLEPLIGQVQCPTLLIWGDLDTATPIGDAKRMEALIADAGLVVCEGAGHFSFAEQPAKVNGALKAFFAG